VVGHGSDRPFPVDFDRSLEPLFHNLDFTSGCRDSQLRLLLEGMEDVDGVLQPDGVDGSKGIAAMVGDNLQSSARKALQRLGIRVLVAHLRLIDGVPNVTLHRIREFG